MIQHIGFIMDGNRRYAKNNNLTKEEGYKKGMEKFLEIVRYQIKHNIYETSFFALSTENYEKRPKKEELEVIFDLMKKFSENDEIETFFIQNRIKIEIRGDFEKLKENESKANEEDRKFIEKLVEKFKKQNEKIPDTKFKVNIALNYGGQKEILHSFKQILKKIKSGDMEEERIDEKTIKNNLWFNDSPEPEIIVRPGDAPRISGFLLWDSQYSEFYLTKKLWTELDEEDLLNILDWYKGIKRNFGK